jgi:hypothetical protein
LFAADPWCAFGIGFEYPLGPERVWIAGAWSGCSRSWSNGKDDRYNNHSRHETFNAIERILRVSHCTKRTLGRTSVALQFFAGRSSTCSTRNT